MIFKLLLVKEGYLILVYAHVLDKPTSTWIRYCFSHLWKHAYSFHCKRKLDYLLWQMGVIDQLIQKTHQTTTKTINFVTYIYVVPF